MGEPVSHLRAEGKPGASACGKHVDDYLLGDSTEGIECKQCPRTQYFLKVAAVEIEQLLAGSCRCASEVADDFGLDEDQVAKIMTDAGHERCETCGWWCTDDEVDIVDDEYVCTDCREAEEE